MFLCQKSTEGAIRAAVFAARLAIASSRRLHRGVVGQPLDRGGTLLFHPRTDVARHRSFLAPTLERLTFSPVSLMVYSPRKVSSTYFWALSRFSSYFPLYSSPVISTGLLSRSLRMRSALAASLLSATCPIFEVVGA